MVRFSAVVNPTATVYLALKKVAHREAYYYALDTVLCMQSSLAPKLPNLFNTRMLKMFGEPRDEARLQPARGTYIYM